MNYNVYAHGVMIEKACYKRRSRRRQELLLDIDEPCITLCIDLNG